MSRTRWVYALAATCALLSACGGGGDDTASAPSASREPAPSPTFAAGDVLACDRFSTAAASVTAFIGDLRGVEGDIDTQLLAVRLRLDDPRQVLEALPGTVVDPQLQQVLRAAAGAVAALQADFPQPELDSFDAASATVQQGLVACEAVRG